MAANIILIAALMVWSIVIIGSLAIGLFASDLGTPLGDSYEVWIYLYEGCVNPVQGHSRLGFVNSLCDLKDSIPPVLSYTIILLSLGLVSIYIFGSTARQKIQSSSGQFLICCAASSAIIHMAIYSFLSTKELIAGCTIIGVISGIYSKIKINILVFMFLFLLIFLSFRSPIYIGVVACISFFSLLLTFFVNADEVAKNYSIRRNCYIVLFLAFLVPILPLDFGNSHRVGGKVVQAIVTELPIASAKIEARSEKIFVYERGCDEGVKGIKYNELMNYFDEFVANTAKSGRGNTWDERSCVDSRNLFNSPGLETVKNILIRTAFRFYWWDGLTGLLPVAGLITHACVIVGMLYLILSLTGISHGVKSIIAATVLFADFTLFMLLGALFPNTSTVYRYIALWFLALGLLPFLHASHFKGNRLRKS